MNDNYSSRNERVSWTGIAGDFMLALAKGGVGYYSGSKALIADALYSGADAAAKLSEILPWQSGSEGNRKRRPNTRDAKKNGEPVLPVVFAVLILMGGLQIAFSAIRDLTSGDLRPSGELSILIICLSLLVKEVIFQYQYRYFQKLGNGSHAAYADNHRFSLYTSLTVLIGAVSSMLGGYLNWHPLVYLDPIAALLAACLILRRGYLLIMSTIYGKKSLELPHEDSVSFIDTVQKVHGVIRVEQLKALEEGRHVNLQVTISVNPRISVMEAYEIADCAKKLLLQRFVHVGEVHMDVVPYEAGYPYKNNFELTDSEMPTLLQ
ncbi:cation diffusion facilitator family transporter [Paenibacillus sp. HN-1]|uniref:cation diffusion facilitator family transporter n=1 Tax=Paenibacillus TaxID=44249 RepID=UPI001CA9D462|nr:MULTISPECIES: cation diffusion facilitator family transporter [Paenibacillus]MBY9079624.1 cation diffusion facilitator family transporter [Paenibacillus sp. CGMCC 1.18879]MBY9084313.1 cation diffusion facilitator family transporter [Paenibacillus sinensis]